MRFFKYLPLLLAVLVISPALHAVNDSNETRHQEELNERDLRALRDFLLTKSYADLLDKAKHMTIYGDVHFEWRHISEKFHGEQIRRRKYVNDRRIPYAPNDFDIEFDLTIEYVDDKSWALAEIDYDNSAGVDDNCCCCACDCDDGDDCTGCVDTCGDDTPKKIAKLGKKYGRAGIRRFHGSGDSRDLSLKRAYMGYQIYEDKCGGVFVEIGRQKLYDIFESDIQFNSRFDGIVVESDIKLESVGKLYGKVGGFVVDERVNHFAWATEFGLLNICDMGLDIQYSFIDWRKVGRDRCEVRNPKAFDYMNSQLLFTYYLDPTYLCRPTQIFAAAVYNHDAKSISFPKTSNDTPCSKEHEIHHGGHQGAKAWAWYAGILIGDVEHEGDWSLEIQYQWVGENSIAFDDNNGIGMGDSFADYCNGPGPTPGFKGWLINGLYAVTDHLVLQTTVQWARSNQTIHHTYSQVQVEAVYAF